MPSFQDLRTPHCGRPMGTKTAFVRELVLAYHAVFVFFGKCRSVVKLYLSA